MRERAPFTSTHTISVHHEVRLFPLQQSFQLCLVLAVEVIEDCHSNQQIPTIDLKEVTNWRKKLLEYL